jgi:hypothetical protein
MPIMIFDAADASAAAWKATAIPTMVMLVNGKEQTRAVGYFDVAAITDWFTRTTAWAKLKYPPPKGIDDFPAPPGVTTPRY